MAFEHVLIKALEIIRAMGLSFNDSSIWHPPKSQPALLYRNNATPSSIFADEAIIRDCRERAIACPVIHLCEINDK